jgi:excisionase family DNA binding protein
MNSNDPLSIPETARRLNVSENVVRKALLRGELKGFKIGRAWRISPQSVDEKLACQPPEQLPTLLSTSVLEGV